MTILIFFLSILLLPAAWGKPKPAQSLTCTSLFLDRESRGGSAGTATLDLGKEGSVSWKDALHTYSVWANLQSKTPINFGLTIADLEGKNEVMIKAQINAKKPFFDYLFPLPAAKDINHKQVATVEVECK